MLRAWPTGASPSPIPKQHQKQPFSTGVVREPFIPGRNKEEDEDGQSWGKIINAIITQTKEQNSKGYQSNALVLLTLTSTVRTMPSDASNGNLALGSTGETVAGPIESKEEYFITRRWLSSVESSSLSSRMETLEPAVATRRSGSAFVVRRAEICGRECWVLWLREVILEARMSILHIVEAYVRTHM